MLALICRDESTCAHFNRPRTTTKITMTSKRKRKRKLVSSCFSFKEINHLFLTNTIARISRLWQIPNRSYLRKRPMVFRSGIETNFQILMLGLMGEVNSRVRFRGRQMLRFRDKRRRLRNLLQSVLGTHQNRNQLCSNLLSSLHLFKPNLPSPRSTLSTKTPSSHCSSLSWALSI